MDSIKEKEQGRLKKCSERFEIGFYENAPYKIKRKMIKRQETLQIWKNKAVLSSAGISKPWYF